MVYANIDQELDPEKYLFVQDVSCEQEEEDEEETELLEKEKKEQEKKEKIEKKNIQ